MVRPVVCIDIVCGEPFLRFVSFIDDVAAVQSDGGWLELPSASHPSANGAVNLLADPISCRTYLTTKKSSYCAEKKGEFGRHIFVA